MLSGKKCTLPSTFMMKSGIVDTKSQMKEKRSKEVMTIFEQQTELIPNNDDLPASQLKPNADFSAYNTSLLKEYSTDIQLIWSLAAALFQQGNGVQHWIRDLIFPGLEFQLEQSQKQHANDPFVTIFTYLSYGQRDLACETAKKLNDFPLAMYITHTEFKDVRTIVKEQIALFRSNSQWEQMTKFHKLCWRAISGDLGYSTVEESVVTERVSWQCALGMYLWYGNRYGDEPSLEKYNRAIDGNIPDIHHLMTVKNTATPDVRCLWYQLLQWWLGDQKLASFDSWPLDLVWLLSLYKASSGISQTYLLQWIDNLRRMDLAEWAIYASLFLSSPEKKNKVDYILRQCEWIDEEKLLHGYHIPNKSIYLARALNAHDEWDYDAEYKILLQGQLYDQAKKSLLYFILPRYFNYDDEAITKSMAYVNEYPDEQDEEIQTIKQTFSYISQNEEKNQDKALTLTANLQEIQPRYGGRNAHELFDNLIKAIVLK